MAGFSNSVESFRTTLERSRAGDDELEEVEIESSSGFPDFPVESGFRFLLKENRLTNKSGFGLGERTGGFPGFELEPDSEK